MSRAVPTRDFHSGRPGAAPLYTAALRVGQICSLPILQARETVSGVHIEVELTGSELVSGAFLGHLSMPVPTG
jgi:hypothetical protein